jgi:hypothetical protein
MLTKLCLWVLGFMGVQIINLSWKSMVRTCQINHNYFLQVFCRGCEIHEKNIHRRVMFFSTIHEYEEICCYVAWFGLWCPLSLNFIA